MSLGAARTVVCGGVGGMSLWIVIFPFDVIKSRMQIQQMNVSMMSLLVKIAQDEGVTFYLPRFCILQLLNDCFAKHVYSWRGH